MFPDTQKDNTPENLLLRVELHETGGFQERTASNGI